MFEKIALFIPVPTWVGFILSLMAAAIGWVFSLSTMTVTLGFVLFVVLAWGWFRMSEYGPNVPFSDHLILVGYALLGHIPYLLVKFFFF
jgi:hypothetical protein